MAHPLFGPEIRMMLLDNNPVGLKAFVETLNPTTIAETLTEDAFTVEQVSRFRPAAERSVRPSLSRTSAYPRCSTPW